VIERIVPPQRGRFLLCASCARQPHYVVSRGRAAGEPAIAPGEPTERHRLECSACARSTGRHPTLDGAELEWGQKWAQMPLVLPKSRKEAA